MLLSCMRKTLSVPVTSFLGCVVTVHSHCPILIQMKCPIQNRKQNRNRIGQCVFTLTEPRPRPMELVQKPIPLATVSACCLRLCAVCTVLHITTEPNFIGLCLGLGPPLVKVSSIILRCKFSSCGHIRSFKERCVWNKAFRLDPTYLFILKAHYLFVHWK